MLEYIIYYVAIGFVLNTALALWVYYQRNDEGYVSVPHMGIYYLTIFSWPKTLWDLVSSFSKGNDDGK